jgi:hypothetical protein
LTCRRLAGIDFPWDVNRSLELALLKTFCLPAISGLLATTGEFVERPRKRYDDTALMVAELLRHGMDSPMGKAVICRMNGIHGHYRIGNDDFLYVLSSFVAEPIRWLDRYGWRPLTSLEKQHLFLFWRAVGERMGIHSIPGTLEDLLELNRRVETSAFRYAESNHTIAEATLAMLLADWPAPLHPLFRQGLMGLLEEDMVGALGWVTAPGWIQAGVLRLIRIRSRLSGTWQAIGRNLGRSARSRLYSERPTPSYGFCFELSHLGPPRMLEELNREGTKECG